MSNQDSYAVQIARYQAAPVGPTELDGYNLLEQLEKQQRFDKLLKHRKAQELALELAESQDAASQRLMDHAEESIRETRRVHESRIAHADADRMAASALSAIGAKPREEEGEGEAEKVANDIMEGLEDISADLLGNIGGRFSPSGESIGAGAGAGAVAGATLPLLIGSGLSLGSRMSGNALLGAGTNAMQRGVANNMAPLLGQFSRNITRQMPGLIAKGALAGAGAGAGVQLLRNHLNKTSRTLDANLVGYDSQDGMREVFLERRTPNKGEAFMRGAMGAGAGIAGGAGLGWLMNARRPIAPILGALLGGVVGGGIGASIPVREGFDPDYGTQVSQGEERRAADIVRRLQPGSQPGNIAVSEPGQEFSARRFGGAPPSFAYAADIDDMALENPNDAVRMLKGSGVATLLGVAGGAAAPSFNDEGGVDPLATAGRFGIVGGAAGSTIGGTLGAMKSEQMARDAGEDTLQYLLNRGALPELAERLGNAGRRAGRTGGVMGAVTGVGMAAEGLLGSLIRKHVGREAPPKMSGGPDVGFTAIVPSVRVNTPFGEIGTPSEIDVTGAIGGVRSALRQLRAGPDMPSGQDVAFSQQLQGSLNAGRTPYKPGPPGGSTAQAKQKTAPPRLKKSSYLLGARAPAKVVESKAREFTHNLTTRGTRSVTEKQKRETKSASEKRPSEEDPAGRAPFSHRKIVDRSKKSFSLPNESPATTNKRITVTNARKWEAAPTPARSGKPKRPTNNVDHTELEPEKIAGDLHPAVPVAGALGAVGGGVLGRDVGRFAEEVTSLAGDLFDGAVGGWPSGVNARRAQNWGRAGGAMGAAAGGLTAAGLASLISALAGSREPKTSALRDRYRMTYSDADNSEVSADVSTPSNSGRRLPASLGVAGGVAGGAGGFAAASLQNAADTIGRGWDPFANPSRRLGRYAGVGLAAGAVGGALAGAVARPRGTDVQGFEGANPEEVRDLAHIYGVSDEGNLRTMPAFESRYGYLPQDLRVGKI